MNDKINSFSKEAIKVRMLQNAVKIWGLKGVSSVDPFVSLLIDAFATEIFKANNEIQSANSRILEKLAKMLTPSIYTYPQPAHAIAHAYPNDAEEVLPDYSEFFIKKQIPSSAKSVSDIQIDIHFTPVDNVRLVKMSAAAMITANMCYIYDHEHYKIPVCKVPPLSIRHNKIILGIDATDY
ncbi:MAG TPA: type VI secretion system baseplate subunit TssF, partial [Flavobacterium sp.]|nr:type VI secretion system baseplate subunit TssF [Flavobacterium sp.]